MFCHKCGSKLLDEAVFCHECGAKLVQGETVQQAIPQKVIDPEVELLMKRANMYLDDKEYERALEYFERVLEIESVYIPAYIGKMCAAWKTNIKNMDKMMDAYKHLIPDRNDFHQVVRFDKMLNGHFDLEKGLWKDADRYFEEVLDSDPEFAPAYTGKLMAELRIGKISYLSEAERFSRPLTEYQNYNRALKFADAEYRAYLNEINGAVTEYVIKKNAKHKEEAKQRVKAEQISKDRFRTMVKTRQAELAASVDPAMKKKQEQAAAWFKEGLCPFCGNKTGILGKCKVCNKDKEDFIWLDTDLPENAVSFCNHIWIVLELQDNRALLLSHRITERRPYNREWGAVTWFKCDIRKYLNGEFYNNLIKSNDWKGVRIAQTTLQNKANPWFSKKDNVITSDKIFLLSLHELVEYFGDSGHLTNSSLAASYREIKDRYNKDRIAYDTKNNASWWWLRSLGRLEGNATYVGPEGEIEMLGENTDNANVGIRSALWIELEK